MIELTEEQVNWLKNGIKNSSSDAELLKGIYSHLEQETVSKLYNNMLISMTISHVSKKIAEKFGINLDE